MTVQTPGLLMAFLAVVACFARNNLVAAQPVCVVVNPDSFTLVARVAFPDFHFGVLGVHCLLFCVRLLLEIHQRASQKRNYEKYLFH